MLTRSSNVLRLSGRVSVKAIPEATIIDVRNERFPVFTVRASRIRWFLARHWQRLRDLLNPLCGYRFSLVPRPRKLRRNVEPCSPQARLLCSRLQQFQNRRTQAPIPGLPSAQRQCGFRDLVPFKAGQVLVVQSAAKFTPTARLELTPSSGCVLEHCRLA